MEYILRPDDIQYIGAATHHIMPKKGKSPGMYDEVLWFIHQGTGWVNLNGEKTRFKRGSIFWFSPRLHPETWYSRKKPLRISILRFKFTPPSTGEHFKHIPEFIPWLEPNWIEGFFNKFHELSSGAVSLMTALKSADRVHANSLLHTLLLEIISETEKKREEVKRPEEWEPLDAGIYQLAKRISENPVNLPSIKEMAENLGISVGYFAEQFKAYTSKRPQEFIIDWRVRHACQLLLETPLPIKAIAKILGYSDVFFFSKQFKKIVGFTPNQYRKENSGSNKI